MNRTLRSVQYERRYDDLHTLKRSVILTSVTWRHILSSFLFVCHSHTGVRQSTHHLQSRYELQTPARNSIKLRWPFRDESDDVPQAAVIWAAAAGQVEWMLAHQVMQALVRLTSA